MNTPTSKEMIEEIMRELVMLSDDDGNGDTGLDIGEVRSALTRLHDATVEACEKAMLKRLCEIGDDDVVKEELQEALAQLKGKEPEL